MFARHSVFLERGVVGVVADHLNHIPNGGLVLSDQLGVFALLALKDADLLLFFVKLLQKGCDLCGYVEFVG